MTQLLVFPARINTHIKNIPERTNATQREEDFGL